MNNKEMSERDLAVIWHPCTQMKDHEFLPMIPIKSAKGIYLEDFEENQYIDAVSSWWVNIFGHTNTYINDKIKEQLDTLEHVILAGFTHEGVVRLSERLVEMTPEGLTKCFYADNGSSGVEVALKMSFHYHRNRGDDRTIFLSLENSYHGETIGALSVGDVELYKETYAELLLQTIQTPVPKDQSKEAAKEAIEALEVILQTSGSKIAAFIIEPLIQGAGYMHMYHASYITQAYHLCEKFGVQLIADEVMTGFGRTGSMFAVEQAEITPDYIVLSKALTGGYLALSCVLTNDEVYQEFYCDYNKFKAFLHSHSYTGNALACAAANATLDIFEKDDVIANNKKTSAYILEKLQVFTSLKQVKSIRQQGMVCAIELEGFKSEDRIGLKVYEYALKEGVLLRPLGHIVYFMPPYIITKDEIDKVLHVAYEAIKSLSPS